MVTVLSDVPVPSVTKLPVSCSCKTTNSTSSPAGPVVSSRLYACLYCLGISKKCVGSLVCDQLPLQWVVQVPLGPNRHGVGGSGMAVVVRLRNWACSVLHDEFCEVDTEDFEFNPSVGENAQILR